MRIKPSSNHAREAEPPIVGVSFAAGGDITAALMRSYLWIFLPWVFAELHPGAPPLNMLWYLRAMCQAFQRTAHGRGRRLVINLPPRNLKSITAIAYIAWMLGHNPRTKIMFVTYGAKLARDHLDYLQAVMSHPFYRRLFPKARLAVTGLSDQTLRTTAGGGCRAVTVGGATTGFGADIIVIDDAMKAEDIHSQARRDELRRFYSGTLVTRLNSKRHGIIISIQQRLGEDDLPGRLIEAGAEHLSLPAYDDVERIYDIGMGRRYVRPVGEVLRPDDEPREELDRLRREMGPASFASEYLQKPSAAEGNVIPIDKILRFDLEDYPRQLFNRIVISVDPATSEEPTADFSAMLVCGYLERKWYLLDVVRDRVGYSRLRDRIVAMSRRWKADKVLIEDAGAGSHLWDDLTTKDLLRPIMIRPEVSKETRMVGQLAMIEDGDFLIPREALWLDALLSEWRAFPRSRHDDQTDALSQFLWWAKSNTIWAQEEYDPKTGRKLRIIRRDKIRRRY